MDVHLLQKWRKHHAERRILRSKLHQLPSVHCPEGLHSQQLDRNSAFLHQCSKQLSYCTQKCHHHGQTHLTKMIIHSFIIFHYLSIFNIEKMIVTGVEPATSRFVVSRSTIDLHDLIIPSLFPFACYMSLSSKSYGKISFFQGAEEGRSSLDPIWILVLWLTHNRNDVIGWVTRCGKRTCSFFGLVKRAFIVGVIDLIFAALDWLEVDHRHLTFQDVWRRFFDGRWSEVYAASLGVKSVDQAAIEWRCFCEFFLRGVFEDEGEGKWVHWQFGLPCVDLEDWSEEALREEESRYPVQSWLFEDALPDEFHPLNEVFIPRRKRLHRWIGSFLPLFWHLIETETYVHLLEHFCHDGFSLYC